MTVLPCPACPVMLQPLEPVPCSWCDMALDYARLQGVPVPVHGPAATVFLSLVSHAQAVHPGLDLADYLEAYLDS